jgi:PD-(D/E)XK nuclease superfamily
MSSIEVLTGRAHVSYSSLTSYLDCGERFRLERIKNVSGEPGYWLAGGSAVHTASEWVDHSLLGGADSHEALAQGTHHFDVEFAKQLSGHEAWKTSGRKTKEYPNGEDESWWRVNGHNMVQSYLDWRLTSGFQLLQMPDGTPAIEVATDFNLPGDVKVKAYIDRVFVHPDGTMHIIDIKTGKSTPPSALQLGLYATALEIQFGMRPQFGGYWMARSGTVPENNVLDRYTKEMLGRWMRDFRKAVESEIFIPHVTNMCVGCSVNVQCYAYSSQAATPSFESDLN